MLHWHLWVCGWLVYPGEMQPPYGGYPQAPAPPPKRGIGTLGIVFIVLGVVLVLGVGTCVGGILWVKGKVSDLVDGGSLDLEAPLAVTSALAGPKKDFVGSWTSKKGSVLDIDSSGRLRLQKAEGGGSTKLEAPIGAFVGDDIELHLIVKVTIRVTRPPHKKGSTWEMTADGIDFERADTP